MASRRVPSQPSGPVDRSRVRTQASIGKWSTWNGWVRRPTTKAVCPSWPFSSVHSLPGRYEVVGSWLLKSARRAPRGQSRRGSSHPALHMVVPLHRHSPPTQRPQPRDGGRLARTVVSRVGDLPGAPAPTLPGPVVGVGSGRYRAGRQASGRAFGAGYPCEGQ